MSLQILLFLQIYGWRNPHWNLCAGLYLNWMIAFSISVILMFYTVTSLLPMLILIMISLLCSLNSYRGRKQYEPPRYMTINTAIEQLLEVEQTQGGSGKGHFSSIQTFTFKCRFCVCDVFGSPNLLLEFDLKFMQTACIKLMANA